jgi:hypothetical protein
MSSWYFCWQGKRTHEEIVCCRTETTDGKELHEVKELAMDVAADLTQN